MKELTKEEIEKIKVMHCAGRKHFYIMNKFNISWLELKKILFAFEEKTFEERAFEERLIKLETEQ
jgi:hypothetical protein